MNDAFLQWAPLHEKAAAPAAAETLPLALRDLGFTGLLDQDAGLKQALAGLQAWAKRSAAEHYTKMKIVILVGFH